jgi:hypothetical protein
MDLPVKSAFWHLLGSKVLCSIGVTLTPITKSRMDSAAAPMSLMAASPHRHTTPDAEEPFGYQVDGHSMLDVDPLLCGHGQPRQHRFQVALCFERRPPGLLGGCHHQQ